MQEIARRRLERIAWAVLAYTVLVILFGAWVRITGSGAGCGEHWPSCHGELVPRSPTAATIIEFTHRVTSGLCLLSVLALLWLARRVFPRGHAVRLGAALAVLFTITEALVGEVDEDHVGDALHHTTGRTQPHQRPYPPLTPQRGESGEHLRPHRTGVERLRPAERVERVHGQRERTRHRDAARGVGLGLGTGGAHLGWGQRRGPRRRRGHA